MKIQSSRPRIGLKIISIALLMIMIGAGLAVLVPVVDEAEGWSYYSKSMEYSKSGQSRREHSTGTHTKNLQGYPNVGWYYNG